MDTNDFDYKVRDNVRYLNNKSVLEGDSELFFTTLWSEVPNAFIADIQNGIMDTRFICYKNALLFADEFNELHRICVEWLGKALSESSAQHKVVITHHCPTTMRAFNGHIGSSLNCAFMVEMEYFLVEHPDIDYWIFGHTHFNGDSSVLPKREAIIGKTRLLTNQLGYTQYKEQNHFDSAAVIEI